MNKLLCSAVVTAALVIGGVSASQAAVISAVGGLSSAGSAPGIIAAPGDARPSGAFNTGLQAFDEQQSYTLTSDLAVDGGIVASGQVVSSHMIFLNSGNGTTIAHGAGGNGSVVSFSFDGMIVGVMSDRSGFLESDSQFLGAAGTIYPVDPYGSRGMEMNPLVADPDWYAVAGSTIRLGMSVRVPGDWIRVVTVSAVPLPASFLLMGTALAGLGAISRRRHRIA